MGRPGLRPPWGQKCIYNYDFGVINQTLQTMIVAMTFRDGLEIGGIVLNRTSPPDDDPSLGDNRRQLEMRSVPPVLAEVMFGQQAFAPAIDWTSIASAP